MKLRDLSVYDLITAKMFRACERADLAMTLQESLYWEREADRLDNERQALPAPVRPS